jgi:hypothetical protein
VPGVTYYVAPSGNDANAGNTRTSSWRTIGKAAATMSPGDNVVVLAGTYDERVNVSISGGAGRPITYQADAGALVTMQGFEIDADYVQVVGFDITNHNQIDAQGWGVYLTGSHSVVTKNNIHDLCFEGAFFTGNNDTLSYNTITHVEMAGAEIDGQNSLIVGNDVSRSVQYPANCPSRNGADADGFRFFGRGHDFQQNYIHDIDYDPTANPNPHTDCFQTWGPASNMTFEQNYCQWASNTTPTQGEIGMIENINGRPTNLTFKNNIFRDMAHGLQWSNAPGVKFWNNTVVRIEQEAVELSNAPNSQLINNIFYDVGGGGDSYACIDSASKKGLVIATNDHYMTSGNPGTFCSKAPHLTLDPQFADLSSFNFHLLTTSPMINAGTTLTQVTNDYYGAPRAPGNFDIGAVQH